MGAKVALFGGVLMAFLALSRRSKEQADARARDLFTERELARPVPGQGPGLAPQNGVNAPETGEADPAQGWQERRWQVRGVPGLSEILRLVWRGFESQD